MAIYIPNHTEIMALLDHVLHLQYAIHYPVKELIEGLYHQYTAGGIMDSNVVLSIEQTGAAQKLIITSDTAIVTNLYNIIILKKGLELAIPTIYSPTAELYIKPSGGSIWNVDQFSSYIEDSNILEVTNTVPTEGEYADIGKYIGGAIIPNTLTASLSMNSLPRSLIAEIQKAINKEADQTARYNDIASDITDNYIYIREGIYAGIDTLQYAILPNNTLKLSVPISQIQDTTLRAAGYSSGKVSRLWSLAPGESIEYVFPAPSPETVNSYIPLYINKAGHIQNGLGWSSVAAENTQNIFDVTANISSYGELGMEQFRPTIDMDPLHIYIGCLFYPGSNGDIIFVPQLLEFNEYGVYTVTVPTYSIRKDGDIKLIFPKLGPDGNGYRLPIPPDASILGVEYIAQVDVVEGSAEEIIDDTSTPYPIALGGKHFYRKTTGRVYVQAKDTVGKYSEGNGIVTPWGPNIAPVTLYKPADGKSYIIKTAENIFPNIDWTLQGFTTADNPCSYGMNYSERYFNSGFTNITGYYVNPNLYGYMTIVITYGYTNNAIMNDINTPVSSA